MQNILDFNSLDQNLLDSTTLNAKYFAFCPDPLHFDALDQNPLDLIGFPVVGSCSTPAVSPHPSPDRPHSSFYWQDLFLSHAARCAWLLAILLYR
jgi:hypothetical protein